MKLSLRGHLDRPRHSYKFSTSALLGKPRCPKTRARGTMEWMETSFVWRDRPLAFWFVERQKQSAHVEGEPALPLWAKSTAARWPFFATKLGALIRNTRLVPACCAPPRRRAPARGRDAGGRKREPPRYFSESNFGDRRQSFWRAGAKEKKSTTLRCWRVPPLHAKPRNYGSCVCFESGRGEQHRAKTYRPKVGARCRGRCLVC